MRITEIHITNFRCFDDTRIFLDDYTCFVGPNGAGKSTVLAALNVFFRETANSSTDTVTLTKEDFHLGDTSKPIKVEVTFEDLSSEAQADFKDYFRSKKLVISAVGEWNAATEFAPMKQYGERLAMHDFRQYFEREKAGASAKDPQAIYVGLRDRYSDLPIVKTKPTMEDALHEYENNHPEKCALIPSEDQFYGVSRGVDRLQKYIQWVYIPAVKDASTEQVEAKNTAIGKLLARRVHSQLNLDESIEKLRQNTLEQYRALIESKKSSLAGLSEALNARFHKWAHDGANLVIDWQQPDKNVSIGLPSAHVKATEEKFEGALARFGHGLQRSFIFALLQELAEHGDKGPKLLLGCEEPELYQHPPQSRYLAGVMQQLSTQNAQVMVSTRSPHFVSGRSFEQIRMVLKDRRIGAALVQQATFDEIASTISKSTGKTPIKSGGMEAKVEAEMQGPMNEMFFATVRVLVEGIEDIAYINSYLALTNRLQEFRSHGCHLVQVNGKSHLIEAIAIAKHFGLPTFVVFDCDGDTPEDKEGETPTGRRKKQEADNNAIFSLMSAPEREFPSTTVWHDDLAAWPNNIGSIVESEIGTTELQELRDQVRARHGFQGMPSMEKNPLFIGYVMALAREKGKKSGTLEQVCERIIKFAAVSNPAEKKTG